MPESLRSDLTASPPTGLPDALPGAALLPPLIRERNLLIEPYSKTPPPEDLQSSLVKFELLHLILLKNRESSEPYPRCCLIVLSPGAPETAIEEVFDGQGHELEKGLFQWRRRDPIFLVRTDLVPETDENLLFRLLARDERRRRAMTEIYQRTIEPYHGWLNDFDQEYVTMALKEEALKLDPEALQGLKEFHETREEVLREIGQRQGIRSMLLKLATRQWGTVPEWFSLWLVEQMELKKLESLADTILDSNSPDAFRQKVGL